MEVVDVGGAVVDPLVVVDAGVVVVVIGGAPGAGVIVAGVHRLQSVDQSMTPWSPVAGGLGLPTTCTMSPIRLKLKKASESFGDRFMQPWDTFTWPCDPTDHGASWTYSPLSEM